MLRRRGLFDGSTRLPDAYQQVEWIGGDMNPYLITNYTPAYSDELHFSFSVHSVGSPYRHPISAGSAGCEITLLITDTFRQYWKWFSGDAKRFSVTPTMDERYDCAVTASCLTGLANLTITPEAQTGNVDSTLYIMARKSDPTQKLDGKIYCVWAKRDGALIFNAVPCYRKADSVIGMYDTVSGTFFTNQGTGAFTKGADV